jgi:hypothetical protein
MAEVSYIGRGDLARGLRNNNPGNIKTGEAWEGRIGVDGPFIVFKSMPWGLRALATDIGNKIRKDGLTTIRQIITKYAPPSENVTSSYINAVVQDAGYGPDQTLPVTADMLHRMIRAITNHELGQQWDGFITDAEIDQGIAMMNDALRSFFQAMGIAVLNSVQDDQGNIQWGKILLVLAVVGGGIYFYRKMK